MKKTLVTLCARGGSKSIPGKNIKLFNGKPLIAYTISHALTLAATLGNTEVALSTDSEQIRAVAAEWGLKTDYLRPAELATDAAGKVPVLESLLLYEEQKHGCRFDYLYDLDITSPLRTLEDLTSAFNTIEQKPEALNLISVSPARRNPYFNMLEVGADGYAHLPKKLEGAVLSRQTTPKVYDMNASFYIYRRNFFDGKRISAATERTLAFPMNHECFDLDEPLDYVIMEFLLSQNKLDFDVNF